MGGNLGYAACIDQDASSRIRTVSLAASLSSLLNDVARLLELCIGMTVRLPDP